MELSFNRILKGEIDLIIPLIQQLAITSIPAEILKERFNQMFSQNYTCYGIFDENEIIGVFGIWEMTRHYAGKMYEVDHIVIAEEYRGKGIGKQLFSLGKTRMQKVQSSQEGQEAMIFIRKINRVRAASDLNLRFY